MKISNKDDCRESFRPVKIEYIEMLRVIAMLAVIFNHSFGYFCCDNAFADGGGGGYLEPIFITLIQS